MAGAFEDISLKWQEREFKIPANKVFGALARVEDIITFGKLYAYMQQGDVPLVRISQAYGSLLRYAGARVEDEEVYAGMFGGSAQETVMEGLQLLMQAMLPASARKTAATADAGQESPPANPPATAS